MTITIPEELVQQFRTVALERLDRVEAAWAAVLQTLDDEAAVQAHRELHTLKGESKMLGFSDVNLVCHKLEDLLEVARARGYAVDEDFDLAVNMAIRFMAMLVRKKVGAQLSGIDLPGFIRQIDTLLAELRPEGKRTTTGVMQPLKVTASTPRIPVAVRSRLAPIAADAYIEYASARGLRRDRLRASWHTLRDLIGIQRAVVGPGQLAKHKNSAQAIGRELGKQVEVVFDVGSAEATAEVLAAIDMAVLHLIRNAVDHGIELPAQRQATGKPETGTVRIQCALRDDTLIATISDDGRGVSMEEVRARALDLGLILPGDNDISDRWLDLVCQPGFSTRAQASDLSGRGVGLDAVRSGIAEVGGTLTATTTAGAGTSWRVAIPVHKMTFDAHVLRPQGVPFPIVIDGSWQVAESGEPQMTIDIAHRLGLRDESITASNRAPTRLFKRGERTIAVVTDRPPQVSQTRRLVVSPPPNPYEVVILDAVEGLLLHLDRIS